MTEQKSIADKINASLSAGRTVFVSTYWKHLKIKKTFKAVKHWEDLGYPFFKMDASGRSLMMIQGQVDYETPKYVDASGCTITSIK